jgi:galactofuranose transport system ATP-binding protein
VNSQQPLLSAIGISKRFPSVVALDQVDFTLMPGEVHALLGENGAGKSTLIKCLTGVYHKDGGEITLDGMEINPQDTFDAQALGIGTVYQEVNLLSNLTVAENMLIGRQPTRFGLTSTRAMNLRADEILSEYGLDIDVTQLLSGYSVALQQIIAIARAIDLSAKVLILDEPTASLDANEVRILFDIMRKVRDRGIGIIFISHFLDQVFTISDSITVLRNGQMVGTQMTSEISRIELVKMMLGYELDEETRERVAVEDGSSHYAFRFRKFGCSGCIKPFDLDIKKGEVVGMAGLLGSGRTETAEVLFGVRAASCGEAEDDNGPISLSNTKSAIAHGFGFCPEDRKVDGIIGDLSVRENIILALQAKRGWTHPLPKQRQTELAEQYIKMLDIRTADQETPVRLLSGGNQQKVILARWLVTNPRFLILDEPTRGIDVGAHAEIIRLIERLCAEGMSLLVISSELEELVVYSHRIIVVRDRAHVDELVGEEITTANIVQAIASEDEVKRVTA